MYMQRLEIKCPLYIFWCDFFSHQTIGTLASIYSLMILSEVGPIVHRELLDKQESWTDEHPSEKIT